VAQVTATVRWARSGLLVMLVGIRRRGGDLDGAALLIEQTHIQPVA
jgi:hypothetical protein